MNPADIVLLNASGTPLTQSFSLVTTIEPNWLYSSLAQSSAAIVGVMGALVISKIINSRSIIRKLQLQIRESEDKINHVKNSIAEKEEWVKKIDEEEDILAIKEFLQDIQDRIDVDNRQPVSELIRWAKESENQEFHNIDEKKLEQFYNNEYISQIRERRAKKIWPFGNILGDLSISPSVSRHAQGIKWDRYRRYSDDISAANSEIGYLNALVKTRATELGIEKQSSDIRSTLLYLFLFSVIGVFLPLFMTTRSTSEMYEFRLSILVVVLLAWLIMLKHLFSEITNLERVGADVKK